MTNPIPWLVDRLIEYDPSLLLIKVEGHPDLSPEQWLALRIKWGMDLGFTLTDGKTAVMFRPVNEAILKSIQTDYYGSIWEYDPFGSITFFDFRYGKGTFPLCHDLNTMTGRKEVAWFYRKRLRRYHADKVPRIAGWQRKEFRSNGY